jgi:hypothetical protein
MAFIMEPNEGNASLLGFGRAMEYSSKFQNICYGTNEGITFLLGFGRAMQYPSDCQRIWYGAQTILGVLKMGYCTFIEYFALWTWIQHALNVSNLNWNSISIWLSTWFTIPPWKTLFEQNLQYPYMGSVKYFNRPLIYFVWMSKNKLHAIPSFYSFLMLSTIRGLLQWQPCR